MNGAMKAPGGANQVARLHGTQPDDTPLLSLVGK
jgi:hypothetical protein